MRVIDFNVRDDDGCWYRVSVCVVPPEKLTADQVYFERLAYESWRRSLLDEDGFLRDPRTSR